MEQKRFISFEGIDFSGKSTQIALLKEKLERAGFGVYVLREPGGTVISEQIRDILLNPAHQEMHEITEILLYSAARAQLVREKIIPLLEAGDFVLADRYADSTTAYQGYGRGIDLTIVQTINQAATGGLWPSVTFLLHLTPQQAFQRRAAAGRAVDRLEQSGNDFYQKIVHGYNVLAREQQDRFVKLDATKPVLEIHEQIWQIIQQRILTKDR